jgi:catechol 2,3-dioxygenase-like lactoylglutathione lyase family enzyme
MQKGDFLSARVMIRTLDPDVTVRFYRDLLGLPVKEEWETGAILGGADFEVAVVKQDGAPRQVDGAVSFGLRTEQLDRVYARLIEHHRDVEPIIEKPWGVRQFVVHAPNGMTIFIFEQAD